MAYYTVIDTNVLVSALLSRHSDSSTVILVERMLLGDLIPVYSAEIMKEYQEVLQRKKFRFSRAQTDYLLSAISRFGLMVKASPTDELLPDPKDLPFYEVVMEKRNSDDAYLVTGNQKHFPIKSFIVTPNEMLDILDSHTEVNT